jgi:DNA modification methylase
MEVNQIFQKDCIEGLKEIPDNSVDLIVTSPPYNFGGFNREGKKSSYDCYDDNMTEEEYKEWTQNYFKELYRVLKPTGMFYFNIKYRFIDYECKIPFWIVEKSPFKLLNMVIWKFASSPDVAKIKWYPRHEYIFVFIKSNNYYFNENYAKYGDVWEISQVMANSKERTEHPAQYPLKLVRRIIESSSKRGDVVLDPFMGSGTSAVACNQLDRKYIGFEISDYYHKIASKRLSQKSLLTAGIFTQAVLTDSRLIGIKREDNE